MSSAKKKVRGWRLLLGALYRSLRTKKELMSYILICYLTWACLITMFSSAKAYHGNIVQYRTFQFRYHAANPSRTCSSLRFTNPEVAKLITVYHKQIHQITLLLTVLPHSEPPITYLPPMPMPIRFLSGHHSGKSGPFSNPICANWVLFKVIFYFPNRKSTIWGIYSEYFLFFGDPLSKSKQSKASQLSWLRDPSNCKILMSIVYRYIHDTNPSCWLLGYRWL